MHARLRERQQHLHVAPPALDLRRNLSKWRVFPDHRDLLHPEAEARSADGEIVVQLVAGELVPERLDTRIEKELPAVGAKAVGRVRVAEPRGEGDCRRMDETDAEQPCERRVPVAPAGKEA